MNKKISLDKETIKLLYVQYKKYLLSSAAILCCVILFIAVIIPQIQNIRDLQEEEKDEAKKLEILRNNINLLSNLDAKTLDDQLILTSKALPAEKDFIGILNAITVATDKANVSLGDYKFQVGDLAKTQTRVKGIPSIELVLTVNGSLDNLISFLKELKDTIPLSEIKIVNLTGRSSTITTLFYYKSLPAVNLKANLPLTALSTSNLELIKDLSGMNNANLVDAGASVINSSPGAAFSQM